MSFADVLGQLPTFTLEQRQMLVRHALELDNPGLSSGDQTLAEERLAAHQRNPDSALSHEQIEARLRARFPA